MRAPTSSNSSLEDEFRIMKAKTDHFLSRNQLYRSTFSTTRVNYGLFDPIFVDFPAKYPDQNAGNSCLQSLNKVEQLLRKREEHLKKRQRELADRERAAKMILSSEISVVHSDIRYLSKLESDIAYAESLLKKEPDLSFSYESSITLQNEDSEGSNYFTKSAILSDPPRADLSFRAALSDSVFSRTCDFSKTTDVRSKIHDIVSWVNERKQKLAREKSMIKEYERRMMEQREEIESSYNKKADRIKQLSAVLDTLSVLSTGLEEIMFDVQRMREEFVTLSRQKGQLERRNYNALRDRESVNEEQMLLAVKRRDLEIRKLDIENRTKAIMNRKKVNLGYERELAQEERKLDAKENYIKSLDEQLQRHGVAFNGKIYESQKELKTIDMIAANRSARSPKKMSLSDELAQLLAVSDHNF